MTDLEKASAARVLLVQFAGDYRAAYRLSLEDGKETYFAHTYVLDQLAQIRARVADVAIMCCISPTRYDEVLPSGVRVAGAQAHPAREFARIRAFMEEFKPTHVIILGTMNHVLRWALKRNVRVLGILADSFEVPLLRRLLRHGPFFGRMWNNDRVDWVANHGLNACHSLQSMGVRSDKIIPWDWDHVRNPRDLPSKSLRATGQGPRLFFAGTLTELKGIGDIIAALALLKQRGITASFLAAGNGDLDHYRAMATEAGVAEQVELLGPIPNTEVFRRMQEATVVIVPSRHRYPEGLPLTIYEALASRTPIISSDHPMFAGRLQHGVNALVYPAGDVVALAGQIETLWEDLALYARLSEAGADAWDRLQLPVKWGELIRRWLSDSPADRAWLGDHALASGRYDQSPQ